MLYALGQGKSQNQQEKLQLQELMGKSVLPLFGLDNESATYPFVDLWGLPHGSLQRAQELAKALPNDTQMLQLFRCYRDLGFVIYPGIADPSQLEQDLTSFLVNRAAAAGSDGGVNEQSVYGKTFQWLGVLFAVLGSGAQCSAMPRKERELTSQVYSKWNLVVHCNYADTIQSAAASSVCVLRTSYPSHTWRAFKHFLSSVM